MSEVIYLVPGAAGFLGSHVCDELLGRGDRVRILVLAGDKSVRHQNRAPSPGWFSQALNEILQLSLHFFHLDCRLYTIIRYKHCVFCISCNAFQRQLEEGKYQVFE